MKVQDINLYFNNEVVFVMSQDDWEGAGDPICMQLITKDEWRLVGRALQDFINDTITEFDDNAEDLIWSEYELLVIKNCTCFYYEDMTDEELAEYESYTNNEDELRVLTNIYNRISNQNNN